MLIQVGIVKAVIPIAKHVYQAAQIAGRAFLQKSSCGLIILVNVVLLINILMVGTTASHVVGLVTHAI